MKCREDEIAGVNRGYTDMGWGIYPERLAALLNTLKDNYGNPKMFITENGMAVADVPDEKGEVNDLARIEYLRGHLQAAHQAIQSGANLQGYFVWSLMDNFEWSVGYSKRFGLVYVDYETQKRILKKSAGWYSDVITHNGVNG